MTAQLVPAFCTAAEVLVLESLIGDNEVPAHVPDADVPLRRLHVKHDRENPAWQAAFPVGEILRFPAGSPYSRCIDIGRAGPRGVHHPGGGQEARPRLAAQAGRRAALRHLDAGPPGHLQGHRGRPVLLLP